MIRLLPRRLRRRLNPSAGPLSIRPRVAWYWRAAGQVAGLAIAFAAGMWIYDRLAGNGGDGAVPRELEARVAALETELERARSLVTSSESRIQIERTAQEQLARQVKGLEEENGRLKEELAFFDTLVPGGDERLAIHRVKVESNGVPGEYRYRMLLTAGRARDAKEFRGNLQLVVNVQRDGRAAVLTFPESARDESYRLAFRRMQRVEGSFRVDPQAKVKSVQIRVLEQGATQPRATESVSM